MIYFLVKDSTGKVKNRVEATAGYVSPIAGQTAILKQHGEAAVDIDWTYNASGTPRFTPPAPPEAPVPEQVDNARLRIAIVTFGGTIAAVDARIAGYSNGKKLRETALWNYGSFFTIDDDTSTTIKQAHGWTNAQMKSLYRLAGAA